MNNIIKVEKQEKWAIFPVKSSTTKSGYTFRNAYTITVRPNKSAELSTAILMSGDSKTVALVLGNAAVAKNKNLQVEKNFVSINDVLKTTITNYSDEHIEIAPFTNLTDFVFLKIATGAPNIVESLDETERGTNGFGSTGLK